MSNNLLAFALYDPAAAVSKATSSLLAMTAFDTTNLRLTVTAPAHGFLWGHIRCAYTGATTTPDVLLGVLDGSTVRARVTPQTGEAGALGTTVAACYDAIFPITCPTPGASITLDAAYAVQVVVASTNIKYGGPNDNSGADAWGGFLFELWDPRPVPIAAPAAVGGLLTAPTTANVGLADLSRILGTALTVTAGQTAAAFKKFFDKATPTGTINSLPDVVPGAAGGLPVIGTGTNNFKSDASANVTTTATVQTGTAQAGSNNTITLAAGASATNGLYDPGMVRITGGTGSGQARVILQYDGATKVAVVDRDWRTNPDNTSIYEIIATSNLVSSNEGLAQAGANNTITLNANASAVNNSYIGETVTIRAGTGQDQSRAITNYVGATKVATVDANWQTNPDSTSVYVIWPLGRTTTVAAANTFFMPSDIKRVTGLTINGVGTAANPWGP